MVVAVLVLSGGGGPALAGGWALTTLDATPDPVAGRPLEVGFTIRQHGQTPVNLPGDVGIAVTSSTGRETFFRAEQRGPVGHFVATVLIDEPGTVTWSVRQGMFAPQDLGRVIVRPGTAAAASTPAPAVADGSPAPYRWSLGLRAGAIALALLLAGVALAEHRRTRRRLSAA